MQYMNQLIRYMREEEKNCKGKKPNQYFRNLRKRHSQAK